jgi:hypothetical protein
MELRDQMVQAAHEDQRDDEVQTVPKDHSGTRENQDHVDQEVTLPKETSRARLHPAVLSSTLTTRDPSDPPGDPDHQDHRDQRVFQDQPVFQETSESMELPEITVHEV